MSKENTQKSMHFINSNRVRDLRSGNPIADFSQEPNEPYPHGPVLYWMQRDQRMHDNWALLHAQDIARQQGVACGVLFNILPTFMDAGLRQYDFMLRGLQELEENLHTHGISFFVTIGEPKDSVVSFIRSHDVSTVVTDFNPLRNIHRWKQDVAQLVDVPMHEVDAHNVIPAWIVSSKQEFAAYTIRPKIHKLLGAYLEDFPNVERQTIAWPESPNHAVKKIDWQDIRSRLTLDASVPVVDWITPGERAAHHMLQEFLTKRLGSYADLRSDPTKHAQSDLSPFLHFGQLSAQRAALDAQMMPASESRESFLEELVVRRELADNFCLYNPHYDTTEGFPDWAKKSLAEHRADEREHVYTLHQLEHAETADPLWNAAQLEMVHTGKMHNYMRMYWAKKIMEWSENPETAMKHALYFNDKYELDGRDPNGFAGVAWSIGGVHDRAWFDRPIFGKIRYMNFNGAKSKFKVQEYIDTIQKIAHRTLF